MVISNAKEIHYVTTIDPETNEKKSQAFTRDIEVLYMRGDGVILVSPLVRT